MRKRKEVVKFITEQLKGNLSEKKCRRWHYGVMELRELLDYVYQREPKNDSEKLLAIR